MLNWKNVKLGEVLKHRKGFIEIDDFQKYKLCRVQNWARGVVLRSELLGTEIKTKKQQVCKAGDFLVAEIDAKMGGYGIVPNHLKGAVVSSHYFLYDVVTEKLDRDFLDFFVKTPQFFEQVKAEGSTNYAAIRPNDVLDYKIPLPPLAEQQRIVARLSALKNKIDEVKILRGEQMKATEAMEQQFLKSIFDKLGLKFGLKPIATATILERGRFGHRPRNAPHLYENGIYPFIQTGEVARAKNGKIEYSQRLSEDGLAVSRLFEPNTVLITIAANIGNTAILDYQACFPDSIVSIRPKEGLHLNFLDYFMRTQKEYLDRISSSTSQKNINIQKLETIKIPLPDFATQSKIVTDIQAAKAKFKKLEQYQTEQIALLNGIFTSLLNKAFLGEL
jgi:type I restriction enzyme, S subunit